MIGVYVACVKVTENNLLHGLNGVQRERLKGPRYVEQGMECIWYVPICAQG